MADEIKTTQVIDNFDYLLFFGKNIEDPDKDVPDILPLHAKQNVFVELDGKKYSMSLTGLKFTRKIYQPGLIEAEVTISPVTLEKDEEKATVSAFEPSFKQVETLFLKRQVELAVVDKNKAMNSKQEGDIDLDPESATTIAKNYYVFMMIPQIASLNGKMEMYVKLTIYSIDKLMDIDKYCKAYSVKKLSSGILASERESFGIPASMLSADIKNLRNLTYGVTDKVEMIQPYLVQYNETFYAFMVRTANRCGEYFYFEDGKLTLGLPENDAKTLSGYDSIAMQGYTDGPVDVGYYSRDSVKDNGEIPNDLNYDPIEKDEAGYPSDAFPTKRQYNAQLAGDEYIFPLEDKKYTNLNRELGMRGLQTLKTLALKAASAWVASEDGNPFNMVAKTGAQMAMDSMNAAILKKNSDDKTLEDLNKSYGSNKEQYDNGRLVAFSSLDQKGWIGHTFYGDIRKKEEELHHKIICIDMATKFTPVSLGDRLHVEGLAGDYIVIQIQQIADINWSHDFTMFNPSKDAADLYSGRQSMKIYAIPMGDGTVMPPVAPVPMYRKAGAQTAFVVDSSDNKYQGRVRIVYPWQPANESLRGQLLAAQESLKEALKALDKYKEMTQDSMKYLSMLKNEIAPDIEKLKGKSAEEVKKYCSDLELGIEKHEERIRQLEEDLKLIPESILNKDQEEVDYSEQIALENKRKEIRLKIADEQSAIQKKQLRLDYLKNAGNDPDKAMIQLKEDQNDTEKKQKVLEEAKEKAEDNVKAAKENVEKKADDWEKEVKKGASPWVRVATPMATTGGGVWFTPNKGDEVLVNYDNDNVERPYVVGSVYSKNTLAPGESVDKFSKNFLQKKASMMMMSPNGQHISFVAPKDGWKFVHGFSPALKTLQYYWPELKGKDLDWDNGKDLAGGIFMGDRFGLYELSLSSHDRKIKINSPYGNVEIGAFTGITIKAPNGDIKISGKNVSIEAGNKLTLHSGKNITDDKKVSEKALDFLKKVTTTLSDNTIGNIVGLKVIDMTIVRGCLEVFLRPIDGTLNMKSNNYVMLESGKGKAKVPLDRYAPKFQEALKMQDKETQKVYGKIAGYIKLINSKVTQFEKDYKELKKVAYEKKAKYNAAFDLLWNPDQKLPDVIAPVFSLMEEKDFVDNNEDFTGGTLAPTMAEITQDKLIAGVDGEYQVYYHNSLHDLNAVKAYIQPIAQDYGRAIIQMLVKTADFYSLCNDNTIKDLNMSVLKKEKDDDTKWIDDVFKNTIFEDDNCEQHKFYQKWTERYCGNNQQPTVNFMNVNDKESKDDPFYDMLVIRRHMIAKFLLALRNDENNGVYHPPLVQPIPNKYFDVCYVANDLTDDFLKEKWTNVACLDCNPPGMKDAAKEIWKNITEFLNVKNLQDPRKPYYDAAAPWGGWAHQVWNDKNGQILFSSDKNATYALKDGEISKLDQISWSNPDLLRGILKSIK